MLKDLAEAILRGLFLAPGMYAVPFAAQRSPQKTVKIENDKNREQKVNNDNLQKKANDAYFSNFYKEKQWVSNDNILNKM